MAYTLPRARVRVRSQQVVAPAADGSYAALGVTSRGPLTPTLVTNLDQLTELYGIGPGVKEPAYQLGKTGVPVLMRRILPTAQAATIGTLDLSQWTGASSPDVTGVPLAYVKAVVEITTAGTADPAPFIALVNELADDALAHFSLGATVHLAADATSGAGIGLTPASTVAEAITRLNQIRAAELLHAANLVAHTAADAVSFATLPGVATAPQEGTDLAVALKSAHNTHLATLASVHGSADVTNVVTGADPADWAIGRYSLDGGGSFSDNAEIIGPLPLGASGLIWTPGAGNLDGLTTVEAYPAAQAVVGFAITRAASSTATPSISGTPIDAYEGRLEILDGGTLGAATPPIRYRYSLDGGRSWTQEFGLGTALAVALRDGKEGLASEEDSGLLVTLGAAAQTLGTGDAITFETTEPAIDAGDVLTALDDLRAGTLGFEFVHVIGPIDGARALSIGSRFQAWAASAVGSAAFKWAIFSTRRQYTGESDIDYDQSVADADYAGLVNARISPWAGDGPRLTCPITQRRDRRPPACVVVPELWARPIEEDPMRVATGPLSSDVVLYEAGARIAHDARQDVALHAARFGTLRTHEEYSGVYVTRGSTFDVVNGQESRIPRRRVLDLAAGTFQRVLVLQIGEGVDKNADGTIDELEAQRLEQATADELDIVLGGRASGVRIVVQRGVPLTPATPLKEVVQVLGLEYLDELDGEIGFVATLPQES